MGQQGQGKLQAGAALITIIVGLIAIWQFILPMFGLGPAPGPSPVRTDGPQVTMPAFSFVVPTTQPAGGTGLVAPKGLQVTGDCANGFVLTWEPVAGATRYMIERDGNFSGSETQPMHEFQEFPDGKEHRYKVIAQAFPNPDSPPSEQITAPACTF